MCDGCKAFQLQHQQQIRESVLLNVDVYFDILTMDDYIISYSDLALLSISK